MIARFSDLQLKKPCGGNGTCLKCRVRFLENAPEATEADLRAFTESELQDGWRLACQVSEEMDAKVEVDERLLVGADIQTAGVVREEIQTAETIPDTVAIDLGTTTIAFVLFDSSQDRIVATHSMTNPQSVFGADVISRIKAANEGEKDQLQQLVCDAIADGYERVIKKVKAESVHIRQILIGGNTTMIHLLLGISTEGLGAYPFSPVELAPGKAKLGDIEICFAPAFSAFVGGDIAAGVYGLGMCETSQKSLLMDLGTNGELALFDGEKLYVASTAAGPAFEGANLSHGVASVAGAIYDVRLPYHNATPQIQTIGNKEPIGLCGTGAIAAVSTLRKFHLIDKHGVFIEEYREAGYSIAVDENGEKILLTQEDIRSIQMAKAAIAAGAELLLEEAGCAFTDLEHIYLAGGMGQFLAVEDAIAIGLLPKEAKEKVKPVGNSCMRGLLRMAKTGYEDMMNFYEDTPVVQIELANLDTFEELYIAHMDIEWF